MRLFDFETTQIVIFLLLNATRNQACCRLL